MENKEIIRLERENATLKRIVRYTVSEYEAIVDYHDPIATRMRRLAKRYGCYGAGGKMNARLNRKEDAR